MFRRKNRDEARPGEGSTPGAPRELALLQDGLGLYQFWFLEHRLTEEVARGARNGAIFSLAVWTLRLLPGEAISRELLAKSAEFIAASLRPYDIATRLDEDRFVALLIDAPYEAAATVAFRIKGELQTRIAPVGRWQAGVAGFPNDGVDTEGLIQTATRRLDSDGRAA
jgi:GGDEF domain-containing protein